MNGDNWVAPALVFFAGAVAGRVLGLRTLVRGTLAAATLVGIGQAIGQAAFDEPRVPARAGHGADHGVNHGAGRGRPAQKRAKARA